MKPKSQYAQLQISTKQAEEIALDLYGITGEVTPLPGELDFNFRIKTNTGSFILKISRPDVFDDFIDFQQNILIHLQLSMPKITSPQIIPDIHGNGTGTISDYQGKERKVRLLTWIDGRLWSGVNPQKAELLFSLGEQAGKITKALQGFDHPYAHREFEWDLSQAEWTIQHTDLFDGDNKTIVQFFQERFINNLPKIKSQRHGVVHNDANDNNVVVSDDLINPEVISIIDYGDAIHTAIINDLAITIAYAVMNKPDVLSAALPVVRAYHKSFPLLEEELELLYTLIVMRLVISVTKSAINKLKEPDNQYLLVSEKPAWVVLKKWYQTSEQLAHYSFRDACGFTAHPNEESFARWAKQNSFGLNEMFPSLSCIGATRVDMGLASNWLGNKADYSDPEFISYKINKIKL
nr:phosphotransferase [Bacteroidota bacterium]